MPALRALLQWVSTSTGLTQLSPSSTEQHCTKQLQLVELDEVPLPWGTERSRSQGNSSYCCNVHQFLITVGRETFSWMEVDVLLGDSLFNSLRFGSKTDISHVQLLWSKSNLRFFVYSFYLATQLHCKKGLWFLWLHPHHGMPLYHLLFEECWFEPARGNSHLEETPVQQLLYCPFVQSASHRHIWFFLTQCIHGNRKP